MTSSAIRRRIDERLAELHERIAAAPVGPDERVYRSGEGYLGVRAVGRAADRLAIAVVTVGGDTHSVGDHEVAVPLHSVAKVFTYGLVLADLGPEAVLARVGVEPSGDAFNALRVDERTMRPFNPMINAGALVTTSLVTGGDPAERFARVLATLRTFAGDDRLTVDRATLAAEVATADRNRGAAYLLRSAGLLTGDVEAILTRYLKQCSVHVTTTQLATMAATLATGGTNPLTGERALPRRRVRDVLSVMHTCGMYDFAGEWAFEVGFPAKSGVSGLILAVIPGKMGIAVWSPGLDGYGNSVRGVQVCRELSARLGLHIFASEEEDALLTEARPAAEPPVDLGALEVAVREDVGERPEAAGNT
ncbi:MAG: glutaminase A [Nitriliruptor sp.]|nr:MAG: glutaminase A [Nitriliruptor sp.]